MGAVKQAMMMLEELDEHITLVQLISAAGWHVGTSGLGLVRLYEDFSTTIRVTIARNPQDKLAYILERYEIERTDNGPWIEGSFLLGQYTDLSGLLDKLMMENIPVYL